MSFLDDFQNLDTEDPGSWPNTVKGVTAVIVIVAILVVGYFTKFKNLGQRRTPNPGAP